jgi:hypothetical protein
MDVHREKEAAWMVGWGSAGTGGQCTHTIAHKWSTLLMAASDSPDITICPPQGTSDTAFASVTT